MTFFNKFIDKAKQSSQQQQHSATSEVSGSEQQPSTPAQTPTKESPSSGLHKITSLLHHKPQPAPHGLATPPANSQSELSRSASLDEPSRMSLDTQDYSSAIQEQRQQQQQRQEIPSQRQPELMNISSSESLRAQPQQQKPVITASPSVSSTTTASTDLQTRPHLVTQSMYNQNMRASSPQHQQQQQQQQQQLQPSRHQPKPERHVRSVPSYTAIYNDTAIIQQRQNRPKLKLSDFHVLRTLGTGSFGRVHLVQSRVNARYYAIKVLKKSEVVRLKQVAHSNNEKHILESVAHPFLVNMWGTFQDDVNLYMVMDYVPGGELFSVLRRSQRFPDHVAKFYAAEVILAIEYLHSKDVIYRDLKPENLLLDAQGHIRITDFGFAKYVPDITWTLCGTPDYLAPEIIQSKGYGKAADWWSLGILIFEMLAGYPPFYDDDHLKLYEKILQGRIRWPQYFDPHAKDLLKRLLTSDLSKRYGNLKNGADDIKNHRWFEGVDFNRLLARQIRAPYIPQIRGDGDASHFDRYPETQEEYGVTGTNDPYRHLFPDF